MTTLPLWLRGWKDRKAVPYKALAEAISEAVSTGLLRHGDKLPPQRRLAWDLGVNPSTVAKAFAEIEAKGLIVGEVGRGTYVAAGRSEDNLFCQSSMTDSVIDLSRSSPAPRTNTIPIKSFSGSDIQYLEDYHPVGLIERSKTAIKNWLAYRGLETQSGSIVPCAGAHAALMAAVQLLPHRKQPLLVEEFTFPGMKAIANAMGFKMIGVECDEQGIIPDKLEIAAVRGCAALVCVPNYQNPTGSIMSVSRRQEIASVVEKSGILVIEDDVYGALANHPPLGSELRTPSVLIGSLSKILAPGLRFGFLCCRNLPLDWPNAEIHITSWLTSPLCLKIGTDLIESGAVFENVEWQRNELKTRYELIGSLLSFTPSNAAPHLWIPVGRDADLVARECLARGVKVASSSVFGVRPGSSTEQFVRVCMTSVAERSHLVKAVNIIRSIIW